MLPEVGRLEWGNPGTNWTDHSPDPRVLQPGYRTWQELVQGLAHVGSHELRGGALLQTERHRFQSEPGSQPAHHSSLWYCKLELLNLTRMLKCFQRICLLVDVFVFEEHIFIGNQNLHCLTFFQALLSRWPFCEIFLFPYCSH